MARIKLSPFLSSISGSVAGVTFQRSKYGNTMRSKPLQLNRQSEQQSVIKSYMGVLHNAWGGLSLAYRTHWEKLAYYVSIKCRRDKSVALSGYNLFLKWNSYRLMAGLAVDDYPDFVTSSLGNIEPALYVPDSEEFVCAGSTANTLSRADELDNWSDQGKTLFTTSGYGMCSNGSRFIATGEGTNTLLYSDNGTSWTITAGSIFTERCLCCIWDGSQFLVGGSGLNNIAYSATGASWTGCESTLFNDGVRAIAFNGDIYVACGQGDNTLGYSYDGHSWYGLGKSIFSTYGRAVAWNGKFFLAGGYGTNRLAISKDGLTWHGVNPGLDIFAVFSIIWDGSKFLIGGSGAVPFMYSFDGNSFTQINISSYMTGVYTLTFNGAYYYIGGYGTNQMMLSTDGFNFSLPASPPGMSNVLGVTGLGAPTQVPPIVYTHEFDPGHNLSSNGKWLVLKLSRPVSSSAPFDPRLLKRIALGSPGSTPYSIGAAYYAAHGVSLVQGQSVWCEMVIFHKTAPILYPIIRQLLTIELS